MEIAIRNNAPYIRNNNNIRNNSNNIANIVQEAREKTPISEVGVCKTCASRTYQDGSNDIGVSFKTALLLLLVIMELSFLTVKVNCSLKDSTADSCSILAVVREVLGLSVSSLDRAVL